MRLLKLALAAAASLAVATPAMAEMVFPSLDYRTGPYAPNGIPLADGYADYFTLLNERDGGIGGVTARVLPCETGYNTEKGVECYESTKGEGALVYQPYSTGITYQLIPKSAVDKIPIFSMGYGRTSAADGRIFPYVFNFPTTYWSQASAVIKYIGAQEGGLDKLAGKKIAHIYHNSAYGKEANPTLELLAKKHGYNLTLLAVDHPGQEQKSTWLQIRRLKPDWIFMSGWGVMNQVAVKEAAGIGFQMDRFIGNWWSGTETDVAPAGAGANGYTATTFHAPGGGKKVHEDMIKHVYDKGDGAGEAGRVGEVLYNRGMLNAIFISEAISNAQKHFKVKNVTGEQVRWGFENIDMNQDRWAELGLADFIGNIKVTCEDHEGGGQVRVQKWDAAAKQWKFSSDWFTPMRDVVRPLVEADAAKYAEENKITPRDCSS